MKRLFLMTLTAAVLATGCASYGMSDADRLALYRANAGAPVRSFHYFGQYDGWTPLGDSALAFWNRPNQAYLLELKGYCPGLDYAHAITVSSQANTVSAGFDKVIVLDRGVQNMPCYIDKIRPLNVKAIRQAETDRRRVAQGAGGT